MSSKSHFERNFMGYLNIATVCSNMQTERTLRKNVYKLLLGTRNTVVCTLLAIR